MEKSFDKKTSFKSTANHSIKKFMKKSLNKKILDYIVIFLACLLQSFTIVCILRPSHLTIGGITGLSFVVEHFSGINYSYVYWGLCVLVLFAAKYFLGVKEAKKIIFVSMLYPIILILMDNITFDFLGGTEDKLLICIYYGLFMGVGTGLIFKRGFSQGGSDTIAKILHRKWFSFVGIGELLLIIDTIILLLSGFIFGQQVILYAIIMQMIYSKTVSIVVFGFGSSKVKVVILSAHIAEISKFMQEVINRRFSIGHVYGGYTKEKKEKIISVCSLREAMLIKNFITTIDENAFINIVPVISAWGKDYGLQRLNEDDEM